jgi:hypothetical protein
MTMKGSKANAHRIDSWNGVEAGLDALLAGPTDGLKAAEGPVLHAVCAAVEHLATTFDFGFDKVMQLLAVLLTARRRARDW